MNKTIIHNPAVAPKLYTINFPDETAVKCNFIEYIPYEPSAYHWDAGIMVEPVGTDNLYFISVGTGWVYGQEDFDADQVTRLIVDAYSPEINEWLRIEKEREEAQETRSRDTIINYFKAGTSPYAHSELVEIFKDNGWDVNLIPETPDNG